MKIIKVLLTIMLVALSINCSSSFAEDEAIFNGLNRETVEVTREPSGYTSFIRWDKGGYTEITDCRLLSTKGKSKIRCSVPCRERYCTNGKSYKVLGVDRILRIATIPPNAVNEPQGAMVEIPGIEGILVIVRSGEAFIFTSHWIRQ